MTPVTCRVARRWLQAFHDAELPVSRQIAVSAHVNGCEPCAAALADLDRLGSWLRAAAPGHTPLPCDEAGAFISTVVNRAKVEHDASLGARLHDLLGEPLLMYAGVGAAAATIACLVLMLGMVRSAAIERSDSLAGMLKFLATQGSNENPFVVDARVMMPRSLDTTFSSGELMRLGDDDVPGNLAGRDAVVTLSAVVTREGTVTNLALLDDGREAARRANGATGTNDAKRVEGLLDAVSRARFEPATRQGLPVAVNMVWLVAETTVRAAKHHPLRGISKT